MKIRKIVIYDEPAVSEINIPNLVNFLKQTIPVEVIVKDNFFKEFSTQQIQKMSESRIFEIQNTFRRHKPSQTDLELEEQFCKNSKIMEETKQEGEAVFESRGPGRPRGYNLSLQEEKQMREFFTQMRDKSADKKKNIE